MNTTEGEVREEAPGRAALWEDFVDVLYAPSVVFTRRRGEGFGAPLAILAVLLAVLLFVNMTVLAPAYEAEMQRTLAEAGQPGMEVDQMVRMGRIFGAVGFLVLFPVGVLVTALLLWAGARLFESREGFTTAGVVATYSQVPTVFQQLAALVQGLIMDVREVRGVQDLAIGLARLLPPETDRVLLALANRVEFFTLWGVFLVWVGLVVGARLQRGAAMVVAVAVWLLGALPELIGAMMGGR
jgi:hypothetical protein